MSNNFEIFFSKLEEKIRVKDEKFLFFFDPVIVNFEEKFLFGFSLKTGVYIFSGITCIQALNAFFDIFRPESFWLFLISICAFFIYLIISFYAFLGAYHDNYDYAKISYLIISVLFILDAIRYAAKSVVKISEFITPCKYNLTVLSISPPFTKGFNPSNN